MARILRIWVPGENDDTLRMRQDGEAVTVLTVQDLAKPDVDRWLARGLFTIEDGVTPPSHPLFFERIADSLRSQFGYSAEIIDEG